jgi:putative transposase
MIDTTRSYKYRIHPTKPQESLLLDALTKHRRLYNAALEQRQVAYRQNRLVPLTEILAKRLTREERLSLVPLQMLAFGWRGALSEKGRTLTHFGQSLEVKSVKRSPGFSGQDSYSLGLTLKRLDKSYKAFFKGGGFPKFKNSSTFRSLNYKIGAGAKIGEKIYLHGIGHVRVKWHRELPEGCKPRQVSVKHTPSGKWVICIQLDTSLPASPHHAGPEVGIDWGITQLAVITDGEVIKSIKAFESARKKLRSQQRVMSRRRPKPGQPASNAYKIARRLVAITHETIANIRSDFNHKTSRYLVKKYGLIVIEKLSIAKMVQATPAPGPLS